ncbi:MAG TPA: FAD-dependent monooxygenase [Nevskiaceae bacterium]|nr:FAD-dependent monooxygenase [Nevskiaceae bacterium]
MSDYDIAIVGGGLVGMSLALALSPRWRVVLVESHGAPSSHPDKSSRGAWDERCLALNDTSQRIFDRLGLWPELQTDAEAIHSTQISERGRFGVARFTAAEAGLEALGWNVPVRVIGTILWRHLAAAQVSVICPAQVVDVQTHGAMSGLTLDSAGGAQQLAARLVVAADGADSTVRAKLGIGCEVRDYQQHAIVSAVRIARGHAGVAYERFTSDGVLAVIPKAPRACSVIHTVADDQLEAWLALPDIDYLARIQVLFGGRLGRFVELGRRVPHPLRRVLSRAPTAARTVFIGNAAQNLHPVAAQGFNLGLRDAANLAAALAPAEDPGAAGCLAAYAAGRAEDREAASGFTDLLVRAFTSRAPGVVQLRHWGLVGAQLLPGVHQRMLHQHLGHRGLPPEL